MTPLFPNPDSYKYNLIAMTSPEAKRVWRRAIKEHFDQTCIYCGKLMTISAYFGSCSPSVLLEAKRPRISYAPVRNVIRKKEHYIGNNL